MCSRSGLFFDVKEPRGPHGAVSGILAGGILGFGTADWFLFVHLHRDLAVRSGWSCCCFLQDPIHFFNSLAHKLPSRVEHGHLWGVFCVVCLVFLLWVFFVSLFFWLGRFFFWCSPHVGHVGLCTGPLLSFDSLMREHTGHCTIRSMAQTLCYDLARAEKAKDGKKLSFDVQEADLVKQPLQLVLEVSHV